MTEAFSLSHRSPAARGEDVTVVTPARDRADLLPRALNSVDQQSVRPAEVIVIDDGSHDETATVASEHGARVLSNAESTGSGPARNRGIAAATTNWIAFLDSDDAWEPNHLETVLRYTGKSQVVSAPAITQHGRLIGNVRGERWFSPVELLVPINPVVTSGVLAHKQATIDAGGFRPLPRGQDLDLWLRISEQHPILGIPERTVRYYWHEGQATNDADLTSSSFDEIMASCRQRPWMTHRVWTRSHMRLHWDHGRRALSRNSYGAALTEFAWLTYHPVVWPTLGRMLLDRREARRHIRERTAQA
jgi:glycosyltransferase involved in cell wall biosynthesis